MKGQCMKGGGKETEMENKWKNGKRRKGGGEGRQGGGKEEDKKWIGQGKGKGKEEERMRKGGGRGGVRQAIVGPCLGQLGNPKSGKLTSHKQVATISTIEKSQGERPAQEPTICH